MEEMQAPGNGQPMVDKDSPWKLTASGRKEDAIDARRRGICQRTAPKRKEYKDIHSVVVAKQEEKTDLKVEEVKD